jgi:hypothetical protein
MTERKRGMDQTNLMRLETAGDKGEYSYFPSSIHEKEWGNIKAVRNRHKK